MTTAIVLPSLVDWTEGQLSSILKASNQTDFDNAFDHFFAKHAQITVNGSHVSREHFKRQLQSEGALNQQSATVTFNAAVGVPKNKDDPEQAGLVGVFFKAIVNEKLRVFGGPAQREITSSMNVVVEQDETIDPPSGPFRGYFDPRRVSALNQVVIEQPVPIQVPA